MLNPVNYFEIPAADFERATGFYESVFECALKRTTIDGNQMAIFDGDLDAPGVFGAIAFGPSYRPSMDGTRVYFHTTNIDQVLLKVTENGGRVEYPKTEVDGIGFVAEFLDTEGNRVALHQPLSGN